MEKATIDAAQNTQPTSAASSMNLGSWQTEKDMVPMGAQDNNRIGHIRKRREKVSVMNITAGFWCVNMFFYIDFQHTAFLGWSREIFSKMRLQNQDLVKIWILSSH
jgi:hypothetical protein